MNSPASKKQADEQGILFFRILKKKLNGIPTRKMISIVRTVLEKTRGSFSFQQLNDTLNCAPSFIQWLVGYNQREKELQIKHLDELVELLMMEDERLGTRLFKSEIETLRIVILILKQIQTLCEKIGVRILPHTIERELQGALISDTSYELTY